MKRVLITTEIFTIGGLETHLIGEVAAMVRMGCDVHLAVGQNFSDLLLPNQLASVTSGLDFGPNATLTSLTCTVEKLRQIIRSHKIDCIHAHPFASMIASCIAAELEGIAFAVTLHGPVSLRVSYGPVYDFLFRSIILPQAGLVVAVSDEVALLAAPYVSPDTLIMLPNSVAPSDYAIADAEPIDSCWLVVSRLDADKIKGVLDLIEKAHAIGVKGVRLVGDGPAKQLLCEVLSAKDLLGFVEFMGVRVNVRELMHVSACVGGMGRVALEGLSERKPVILVGYDGVKGVLNPGLFHHARLANFSGRNLPTIDTAVLKRQIGEVTRENAKQLSDALSKDFSEDRIWTSFLDRLQQIPRLKISVMGSTYLAMQSLDSSASTEFLQSPCTLDFLLEVAHGKLYFDARLISSLNFARHKLVHKDLEARDGQISSLSQELMERDDQISSLSQELMERDNQISSLSQEVAAREGQNATIRTQLIAMSDWGARIDARPLHHAFKKTALGFARATLRAMPVSISTKQRLRDAFYMTKRPLRRVLQGQGAHVSAPDVQVLPMATCAPGGVRDIFVFAVIDWHFRIQRPQHLAKSLAMAGYRVFYLSNHFVDADVSGYEIERIDAQLELYQVKLQVSGAPAIYFAPPSEHALRMIQAGLAQLIRNVGALSTVSLVQHSYWYPVAEQLPNSLRVYDCMDHHEGFGNVPEKLIEIEKRMLRQADLVVVTSSWLDEFARGFNPNVAIVRNAGEFEHFATAPEERYHDLHGRKIIGYFGAIAEWFDLKLIRAVAETNPEALVLLVGNDTIQAKLTLKDIPNITFTGEVPYARLPYYLHAFNVSLLPFQVIPLTLATNPVKVYEYLAAGKPVVAVDLPEISQFGNLVHRAVSHIEFCNMVKATLSGDDSASSQDARRRFACEQTWNHRAGVLDQAFRNITMPKISIIVLTYNNLDLTKACLESLIRWTDYPHAEIIVVDNASTDSSPDYLRDFQTTHPEVRVLLNDTNLGFAAGNNVGLAAATGDYLVMLNNDTVVTPGWLLTMLRHLQADSSIGLIGPVTNNIGNEARIDINYDSPLNMLPSVVHHTTAHMGQEIPLYTAAFFCVMMSRSVYERVGPLDEKFGRGFFEDDDYCRRVEQLGLRIVCAEDVFIHHHLSASFNKLGSSEKQKLFEENKTYYESKWGTWAPHAYR